MKTLKKTLCLVLAVVMAVGVLVIPTSAAFDDDADIKNKEAVAVLTGLGILNGVEDGSSFNPEGKLSRAEAAKIINYLAQTPDDAKDYVGSTEQFSDVASDYWAINDIAYCVANGIISGDGAGHFLPTKNLTGHEFAKMLLCALGYDAGNEGFTGAGDSWKTAVENVARGVGLNSGISAFKYSDELTRDQAAQMAYNAMSVKKVTGYEGGNQITLPGGITISQGAKRTESEDTLASADYSIVKLDGSTGKDMGENATDTLGRPNSYEIVVGKINATEAEPSNAPTVSKVLYVAHKAPVATYTQGFSNANTVTADLKNYSVKLDTAATTVKANAKVSTQDKVTDLYKTNGGEAKDLDIASGKTAADAINGLCGNGVVVEVYATNQVIDTIVVVDYKLVKVKSVSDKKVEFETGAAAVEKVDDGDNTLFNALSGYAKDDYLMVAVDGDNKVLDFAETQEITGMLTAVAAKASGANHNASYTIDGTKYYPAERATSTWSITATEPTPSADTSVVALLDQYGYIVDFLTAKSAAAQYLYLVYPYKEGGEWNTSTRMFQGVLTDGTEVVAEYKMSTDTASQKYEATKNKVYSYSESDGVYTLTKDTQNAITDPVLAGAKRLPGSNGAFFASNVQTIFITGSMDDLEIKVRDGVVAFTGEDGNDFPVLNSSKYVTTIFVNGDATPELSTDLIYVKAGTTTNGQALDEKGTPRNTYEVYINGVKETVMLSDPPTAGWNKYRVVDGYYVLTSGVSNTEVNLVLGTGATLEKGDGVYYLTIGNNVVLGDATNATVIDLVNTSGDNQITSIEGLVDIDMKFEIAVAYSGNSATTRVIDFIYITDKDPA